MENRFSKPDPRIGFLEGAIAPLRGTKASVFLPWDPKSYVVVEPTEGHDTSASSCRWGIVAQYIEQGSVDGLDISCMEEQKPSFVARDD